MEEVTEITKERIRKDRNYFRTQARLLGDVYTKFRKRCIDLHIPYKQGIEQALRLWLKEKK